MPIDDGVMARIRRSGWAGSGPQATQEADDRIARNPDDYLRTQYENLAEKMLHREADQSAQDHSARQAGSTGGAGVDTGD